MRLRRGFTLLEIVLAISLLLLMSGLVVVGMSGLLKGNDLDDGLTRYEAVIRRARADAASSRRRLRLSFDDATGRCTVLWEENPTSEPGVFTEYRRNHWVSRIPNESIRVSRCEVAGITFSSLQEITDPSEISGGSSGSLLQSVTFYPNGSSDSFRMVLEPVDDDPDASMRGLIEVSETMGVTRAETMDRDRLQDYLETEAGF
ncbi:MAG: Tfp pilus assembly protein FimT/FimU [Phycisphaerae bacterium]